MKHIYLLFLLITLNSCNKDNTSDHSDGVSYSDSYTNIDENYNGTYCAEVEYYNPNTGSTNTYELDVEVENGYLTQINWPNGGWLDETHFTSEDISSGECSFSSDRGYEYTVILGEKGGGCYSQGNNIRDNVNQDTENTTCSICGDEKHEYDNYCYSCQRKIEEQEQQKISEEADIQQRINDENDEY